MNMNDTEIVYSIMEKSGYKKVDDANRVRCALSARAQYNPNLSYYRPM